MLSERKENILISEAKQVLKGFRHYYPKTAADGDLSAPKLNWAPNHPAVIPIEQDDQILRNLNAKDYCWSIEHVIKTMRSLGYDLYPAILHKKYLLLDPVANIDQARRMHVSKNTFYRKLNSALLIFTQIIPIDILNHLYKMTL